MIVREREGVCESEREREKKIDTPTRWTMDTDATIALEHSLVLAAKVNTSELPL